ncbi:MAG: DegT/DnrJ/EryC1/StrS family aminotransferase [Verrucomicrobiota bacterium]
MGDRIPVLDLDAQLAPMREEILAAVDRCLGHKGFCLGREVEAFEEAYAEYHGVKHGVGVNSGTSALHLAARLLELGPGDEVITTPMTFVATAWAIDYVGAKPVFVDIEADTMNMDMNRLEAALTPRTKAVFAVHLFGQPCDLGPVRTFCEENGLALVEDAAQAHGAEYEGHRVGGDGRMSIFSFYPGKNLGACGEGGIMLTNEDRLAERARALRNHGSEKRYYHEEVGYNYRMEGIQAAILGLKLRHLDEWTEERRRVAGKYHDGLEGTPLRLPVEREGRKSVYHLYVVRHSRRDELAAYLGDEGIGTGLHYPVPLHLQKSFSGLGYRAGDFPEAERMAEECLSLPMYPELRNDQVERVCGAIVKFFRDGV